MSQDTALDTPHLKAPGPARPFLELVEPVIESLGYSLLRIRMTGDDGQAVLQIMAENDEAGLRIEQCEEISRALSDVMDVENPIAGAYALEVSSSSEEGRVGKEERCGRAQDDQEKKKELAPLIKSICKKHGIKATLGVHNYSELVLNIKSGSIDFGTDNINEYWYHEHFADNPKALAFLSEVIPAMNIGNFDKSDVQTDYFHVGWYMSVNLGKWDKPYILNN